MATKQKQQRTTTTTRKATPSRRKARQSGEGSDGQAVNTDTPAQVVSALTPDFLSVGRLLMEEKIPVRALAGAIRKHGIVAYDDLDMPQRYLAGTQQAEAALDVLRACHARRQDPEPSHDTGFERDDHDWAGYRYGWLSDALPDFEAIERASFAMVTAKTLGRPIEPAAFTTLYELLNGGLATTATLDHAIHAHGVYEQPPQGQGHDPVKVLCTTPALASLAAYSVDAYKGPEPHRSLWGPGNPLHTHGWPAHEVPKAALDVKTAVRFRPNQHWQRQLEGLFDPDFTTVGCLLITGRAKPSAIAAAVTLDGIDHRRAHNLPQPVRLPWGCGFADVTGAMGRLSRCIDQLSQYERSRLPIPIKEFQDGFEVLQDWGWTHKTLPVAFQRQAAFAAAVPGVCNRKDVSTVPELTSADGIADEKGMDASPPAQAVPLHPKTKSSYLALIGVLRDIILGNTSVYGYDKTTKQYTQRKEGEKIIDADITYTIKHYYQGLKNISKSQYKTILAEFRDLHLHVPEILNEAQKKVEDSHLTENEKLAQRKKGPKSK
jgi:hypothetical protein